MKHAYITTKIPKSVCPGCGKVLNAATDPIGDSTPCPGDATICIGCCTILIFNEDMSKRLATQEEIDQAPPEMKAYIVAIKQLHDEGVI